MCTFSRKRYMMFSLNELPTSINYRDVFRPLIALQEETDPLTLIGKEANSPSTSSGGFISSLFFSSGPESLSTQEIGKLFRKKIKAWIEKLDAYLEKSRFDPLELSSFQEAVRPIYMEGKTTVLRRKIEQLGDKSPKTVKVLNKLDKYLLRVLQAPHLAKIAQAEPDSPSLMYAGRSSFFSMPPFGRSTGIKGIHDAIVPWGTIAVDSGNIQREMVERTKQLQITRRVKEVTLINHKHCKDWEENFVKEAALLFKEKELIELGKQVSSLQLITLIRAHIIDQKEEWKLPFIICSLDCSNLIEMLASLEPTQLSILNIALKKGVKQNPEWIASAIKQQAEVLLQKCIEIEESVDILVEKFRSEEKTHLLKQGDMLLVNQLRDTVRLHYNCLSNKLPLLYRNLGIEKEARKIIDEGLSSRYRLLLKRLTDSKAPEENPDNCLLPVIYEKVFDSTEFTSEEKAFEMLGEWCILQLADYLEAGLFGGITNKEFELLINSQKPSDLYSLAVNNLSSLGIKTIADWKKIEIFNAIMLKEYLNNPCRSQKLRERSMAILNQNDI